MTTHTPNESTSEEPENWLDSTNPPVFLTSAGLILGTVLLGIIFPTKMQIGAEKVLSFITKDFGWFYVLSVALLFAFAAYAALSSFGTIKLGPDDSEPDFSFPSWIAMLFSAGMGIGLLYFGVYEPVNHWSHPPIGEGHTLASLKLGMKYTFLHWGIHAWAIYAVLGMSLAYFGYRYDLPLTIRSSLYPLVGDRIQGWFGHWVDVFAVLGTMFGVATSLGYGVQQVNTGLDYLFDIGISSNIQILLIAIITGFATVSVVSGLDSGIRVISELNLGLAVILLIFVLFAGETIFLLQAYLENCGEYLGDFTKLTFNMFAYEPGDWFGKWTITYWAWWISWSPFVGMFIARISRGRTIREFVLGVCTVPVAFTFFWMTCFGNTAIRLDMGAAAGAISKAIAIDESLGIFTMYQYLPWTTLLSVLTTVLVVTFFVTSSDSGSLVIDIITSGGQGEPPVWQRVFWAVTEGSVAAVLLKAGGLAALQAASQIAALPFTIVLLLVAVGMYKALSKEGLKQSSSDITPAWLPIKGAAVTWQKHLKNLLSHPKKATAVKFLEETVNPAFTNLTTELKKNGLESQVEHDDNSVTLKVLYGGEDDFIYGVHLVRQTLPSFVIEAKDSTKNEERNYFWAEVYLASGGQGYDILGYTDEQLISDVLSQLERHQQYLSLTRA